jgi:hypothetical protein
MYIQGRNERGNGLVRWKIVEPESPDRRREHVLGSDAWMAPKYDTPKKRNDRSPVTAQAKADKERRSVAYASRGAEPAACIVSLPLTHLNSTSVKRACEFVSCTFVVFNRIQSEAVHA